VRTFPTASELRGRVFFILTNGSFGITRSSAAADARIRRTREAAEYMLQTLTQEMEIPRYRAVRGLLSEILLKKIEYESVIVRKDDFEWNRT